MRDEVPQLLLNGDTRLGDFLLQRNLRSCRLFVYRSVSGDFFLWSSYNLCVERSEMRIANPAYDVVFKYLLDDNKVAKKLLSLIIEQEVVSLELKPTEHRANVEQADRPPIAVLRIDFAATVQTADGKRKQILIELQKAKLPTDIMRFRRYLASHYSNPNNVIVDKEGKENPLPILTIYFLGHYLEHTRVPVIEVNRRYIDKTTREEILEKEDFIESLTHDSIIIQIPALKTHRRNRLEKVLSVFDVSQTKLHFIDVDENAYPEEFKEVIDRLMRAASSEEIRETMIIEDDIVEVLVKKDRALALRDEVIAEKDEALTKAQVEKDMAVEKVERAIDVLAEKLGISRDEAAKIIKDE